MKTRYLLLLVLLAGNAAGLELVEMPRNPASDSCFVVANEDGKRKLICKKYLTYSIEGDNACHVPRPCRESEIHRFCGNKICRSLEDFEPYIKDE